MKNDYGAKVGKNYLKLHEKEKTSRISGNTQQQEVMPEWEEVFFR